MLDIKSKPENAALYNTVVSVVSEHLATRGYGMDDGDQH